MGKIKVTRQELKRDELKDLGENILQYYELHRMTILVVAGVVAVLWISVKLWGGYSERKLMGSSRELAQAMRLYTYALGQNSTEDRADLLGKAITGCEGVRNKYPGTRAARQSLLVKGNALFFLGHADSAITQFKEFQTTTDDRDELAQSWIALGYCYENEFFRGGMREKDKEIAKSALQAYKKAQEVAGDSYLARQALLGQARLFEVTFNLKTAIATYQEVVEISNQLKEQETARFGAEEEERSTLKKSMLPTIAEVYDSGVLAQTEIDRLIVLLTANEVEAAIRRSAPPAPEPTAESEEEEPRESESADQPAEVEESPAAEPAATPAAPVETTAPAQAAE